MDETTREEFRKAIPHLRQIAGFTTAELASRLGISRAKMASIENTPGTLTMVYYLAILKLFELHSMNGQTPDERYLSTAICLFTTTVMPEPIKEQFVKDLTAAVKAQGTKKGIRGMQTACHKVIDSYSQYMWRCLE